MRITVDEDKCVAAGQCAALAPAVFDQRDEDGVVILLDAEPAPTEHEAVRKAAAACPAVAIFIEQP